MTDTMQAIGILEPGGADVLQLITCEIPQPGENDVLIKVRAAGVNRPDVLQRQGLYPLPPDASPLPGLEVAGEIVARGSSVTSHDVGDRVMALTHGGGYAEYCRAHETHCLTVPPILTDIEAAAIPETFFTVYYNVFTRGALAKGETLLVHGGSSGIGTTAIQLAKAHGCKVIVTAGSDKKCKFCLDLGADVAINYRQGDWEKEAIDGSDGRGPDVILDMVAGPYMQKNINILARDGRYVIIAFLQGPKAELNMRAVLGKRLTITGSTLRPQSDAEKGVIADNLRQNVLPLLESGRVKPIIYHSFPLAEAGRAHEMMESSHHMGKIVLEVA
jgi:putative PIG3 family NAD(P)H quinone oxidoreductase